MISKYELQSVVDPETNETYSQLVDVATSIVVWSERTDIDAISGIIVKYLNSIDKVVLAKMGLYYMLAMAAELNESNAEEIVFTLKDSKVKDTQRDINMVITSKEPSRAK